MCGIAGVINFNTDQTGRAIEAMLSTQAHRGPDATDEYIEKGVGLGHNRLAIIDLDAKSNQPFYSKCGNYVLIFNGEIYNYKAIKEDLSCTDWTTQSDTEVLLEAYLEHGISCLALLNGMFSFAIWNKKNQSLFFARDRVGIKPFYYSVSQGGFVFASELRTVLKSGLVSKTINIDSVQSFLQYQWIQSPDTIMQDISQLNPGTFGLWSKDGLSVESYWEMDSNSALEASSVSSSPEKDVKNLFYEAVERRMVADVPLGAFLSGGIDSSAIVAAMSNISSDKVNTFSIGFEEKEYDESMYAEVVAKRYKTEHQTLFYNSSTLRDEVPHILANFDTPTTDGVNTYIISNLVKEAGITVALSGLGGDELFCGYPVFKQLPSLTNRTLFWKTPKSLRSLLSFPLSTVSSSKFQKLARLLKSKDNSFENLYPFFREICDTTLVANVLGTMSATTTAQTNFSRYDTDQILRRISLAEISGYTQNVLLKDSDMCSMTHALELRLPFFDHTLVEYVLGLPDHIKTPTTPKKLLTDALSSELPHEVVNRKKMGFAFPWDIWLRKDLKTFVETTLSHAKEFDFFNSQAIQSLWHQYLANKKSIKWYQIWNLVCIIHWLRNNISK